MAKKYQAIIFDEAGDGLYSRDAMSQFNKLLNKTYMVIRGNNNLTFFDNGLALGVKMDDEQAQNFIDIIQNKINARFQK